MRRKSTLLTLCLISVFLSTHAQQALTFNGTDNYITTATTVVPTTGDFTVEFWAFRPTAAGTFQEFVSQGQGTTNGFYIGIDAGGGIRCGDAFMSTGVTAPINEWYHVALVNSGGTATLFVNGVQRAQKTGYSIAATGSNFTIGQQFAPYNELLQGDLDELRVWSVARTNAEINAGMYRPVSTSAAGLIAYYKLDGDASNSTATAGLDGTLQGTTPTFIPSPVRYNNNALSFDGVNDQVDLPGKAAYDITTGTIEVWVNPAVTQGGDNAVVGVRSDGLTNTRFSFHVGANRIGMWNGTNFQTVTYTVPVNTPTGTHLAFVCDGVQTLVYVNGTPQGAFTQAFGTGSLGALAVGVSKNGGGDNEFFNGAIDEVRIWNIQRTQTEIAADMGSSLKGDEAGLVALLSFDQGIADGDNTGLVPIVDNSSTVNAGTLQNFALNNTGSNFTGSPLSAVVLPVIFASFDVTAKDGQALLAWKTAKEQNSAEFIIERSANGKDFSSIGSVAAAGNSNTPLSYYFTDASPAAGTNYYRVKERDLDGQFLYSTIRSATFSYSGVSKIAWASIGSGSTEITVLPASNEHYSIVDLNGRKLQQGRLSAGKLYLSGMSAGVYIVNVTTNGGAQLNTRFIVR